jgi:hypothetical protein
MKPSSMQGQVVAPLDPVLPYEQPVGDELRRLSICGEA